LKLINNKSDSSSEEDDKPESSNQKLIKSDDEITYCNLLNKIIPVKWHTNVKIIIEKPSNLWKKDICKLINHVM
jgi:hypothetical protein